MRKLFSLSLCLWSSFVFAQAGGLVNGSRAFPVPNDGTTGTLLNGTATIDSAGQAIQATPANTTVPVFIVVGGAGLGGNAALAAQGTMAACTMDATIASGGGNYWVIQSTTNAPECHPQATAPGAGVWVIGYLLSSSTVSGSAALVLVDSFIYGGTGGGGGGSGTVNPNPGSVGAAAFYNCNASCTVVTPNLNITFDSSGDATFTGNVTGASFISPGDWLLTTPFAGASLACSAPDSCSGINTDGNFYVSNNGGPFSVALTPLLLTPAIVGNAAFGSGGGTANAPTWTHLHSNAITAYVPDMELALVPTAANTSSTVTLQADGIVSPVTVYRTGCSLANGDLNNSTLAIFRYDGAKSAFLLLNPQSACGGGGSGSLSGMTANGIPIAATSSTVTSSLNSNVTGAIPTFQNGASPVASNPSVADSSSSPVTSANFTFACPNSTSIADDGHTIRFRSGASTPIIPLSSSTGCANVVVVVMDDGAGSLVFSRTSPDTFSVFNGATNTDSATSFTLTNGEFASLNQAASGIWEVRITQGGATGGANTTLSNLSGVAVNSALLPGTSNSIALGSSSFYWSNLFATAVQCGIAGTTSCVITGAGSTSGTATITWPAVAGTTANAIVSSNNLSAPVYSATATTNQFITGASSNLTTLNFPASSGAVTLTFPITTELMAGTNSDTTVTHIAHSTAVAGVQNMTALVTADLPAAFGTPTSLTLTNATGLPLSTGVTGTLAAAQFPALTGDLTGTATSLSVEVTGLLNHALPSLATGYLNWTGSAWALSSVSGGAGSLDQLTGAAAQATGTETAAGHNYTFAGVETGNLTAYLNITDANSSNNNTNIGIMGGVTGTSAGGIGMLVYDVSGTGDIARYYSGGSVSNGTYTVGTLEAHLGATGAFYQGSSAPTNTAGTGGGAVSTEGTGFTGVSGTAGWYANNANNCFDMENGTSDIGCGVGETSILSANILAKATGTTSGLVASSITDNGTDVLITEPLLGSNSTQLITPTTITSTSLITTGLVLPTVPISTTVRGQCRIIWEQSTAVATATFGVKMNNAPTDLWVEPATIWNGTATGAGLYTTVTSTTATNITNTITPAATATGYSIDFGFVLETGGTNTVALTIDGLTSNGSDALVIEPGSYCGWLP